MKDTLAIRQDTAHSTPPVFHPTDCKLSTMNAVHVLSCIASFWHHHQNPANLTLYRSFCFKRLSMIYFRFSLFSVTGQFSSTAVAETLNPSCPQAQRT